MNVRQVADGHKTKKINVKRAIALAMKSRWEEAVTANRSILADYPDDLETCNRLGKALSELGRNREARDAFRQALSISPANGIARKNLERLTRLADETPRPRARTSAAPQLFIEEGGKAAVVSLADPAPPDVLLKLAPGHAVYLQPAGRRVEVVAPSGEYLGQIGPRWETRLTRLINGGNRYDAVVTSVSAAELTVIVREAYKHPSQTNVTSFPSRGEVKQRTLAPRAFLAQELNGGTSGRSEPVLVKDWSDDDTEPGDDDAFTSVIHRIINTDDEQEDF